MSEQKDLRAQLLSKSKSFLHEVVLPSGLVVFVKHPSVKEKWAIQTCLSKETSGEADAAKRVLNAHKQSLQVLVVGEESRLPIFEPGDLAGYEDFDSDDNLALLGEEVFNFVFKGSDPKELGETENTEPAS